MPDPPRRYVRVYYSIVNDERFADIFHEARHLGTWLQLLLLADAMYPADSPLPAYIDPASEEALVAAGLVEERPHQHFRMHGLANERALRSQYGRNAAAVRWQSDRISQPMPRTEEKRIEEKVVRIANPEHVASIVSDIRQTLSKPHSVPKPPPSSRRK